MNKIVSVIILLLATAATGFLGHMLVGIWGLRKSNRACTIGFLEKTVQKGSVFQGHPFSGRWHKHWQVYTYVYSVDGKEYQLTGGRPGVKKDLPFKVEIQYQRNKPKRALIPAFDTGSSVGAAVFLLAGCLVLYAAGISVWNM